MIYIIGDTHYGSGDELKLFRIPAEKNDVIIIAGDCGVVWNESTLKERLDNIAKIPCLIAFVEGNHENYDMLYSYQEEYWNGGKIHRISDNLIHLNRGEIYNIEGHTFYTFGGGYSIDKWARLSHISWWPQELPTEEEMNYGKEKLLKVGNKVDYIITHAVPFSLCQSILRSWFMANSPERPLQDYFDYIRSAVDYRHWFMGQLHYDIHGNKETVLYCEVYKISINNEITKMNW